MAKSKHRTIKKRHRSASRSSSEGKKSNIMTPLIAGLAVVLIAAAAYFFYFRSNEITTPSGLKYTDIVEGTGAIAEPNKRVSVHYTGTLENGTKFDSSVDKGVPLEFTIGQPGMIAGWDEGVRGMKVGGKRKLIIPPHLGYGAVDKGSIPPNSTLLFDIELLDVK